MKIVLFANTDWYLYNFRLSLLLALEKAGHEVLLLSPDGPYVNKLTARGFRWEPIDMERRSLNPFREIFVVYKLIKFLRRERPDIIHSFTIKSVIYGSLAARLAGVGTRISAIEGLGYVYGSNELLAKLLRPVVRVLLKLALAGPGSRLILLNSDDVRLVTKSGIIREDRIELIRGAGVNCEVFHPPEPNERSIQDKNKFKVLLAARLLWEKGIEEYVSASRRLKSDGMNLVFLLAGAPDPGNPASVPEGKLKQWVNDGLIEWLGHVDNMAQLLREVDAVVLPSYYREGLPTSLTEGAATGLPLITCDTPGCREVVSNDDNGILIPPRDSLALADSIKRLACSPRLRKKLGAGARARALAEFSEEIVIERTLRLYETVC